MRKGHDGERMKAAALLLALALPAFSAVDGFVTNATAGKPQPGTTVTLINLGKGMQTLASVKADAEGRFRIDNDLEAGSPHLLQALYEGVTYNRILPPGSPSTGVEIQVYDAVGNSSAAQVTQHMILLEPSGKDLAVNETFIYTNAGKTTFNTPDGTLRFYIPAAVTSPVRVTVQAPQGMPVQRQAEKTKDPNTWTVKAPIKPGETRIDISYGMPSKQPATFTSRILHGGGPVRIVVPKGVKLEGPAVQMAGVHPQTQATIYNVTGKDYTVQVEGTGSLRASAPPQQETGGNGEEGPGIDSARPMIYRRLPWILALSLGMLSIGFIMLYRTGVPSPVQPAKLNKSK